MFGKKFVTERLIIREYQKTDIDDFLRVVRQPEIYVYTYGIPKKYSRERARWWLETIQQNLKTDTAHEFAVTLKLARSVLSTFLKSIKEPKSPIIRIKISVIGDIPARPLRKCCNTASAN